MKPSELFIAVNGLIDARLPGFVWGAPGIGKSEIMAQVAASRSTKGKPYELRDVRLGLLDPTDIKGFPSPDPAKNLMRWLPPDFLPTKGQGLLFLDEANTAPPAVQAASYQLFLNRAVGSYKLPDGWDIMAAGNRESDRAVVHTMGTALKSRLVHMELDVDVDEWCKHARKCGIHEHRIAFIRFRRNLLHAFDPTTKTNAFPCPRTWFFADKIARQNLPRHVELELLKGTIGENAAAQYMAFIQVIDDIPKVEDIALHPDKVPVPASIATQHAIVQMLSSATKESNFSRFLTYIRRLPEEFQVTYIRDVTGDNAKLLCDPAYKDWIIDHGELLV